jgi:hypothetical protein
VLQRDGFHVLWLDERWQSPAEYIPSLPQTLVVVAVWAVIFYRFESSLGRDLRRDRQRQDRDMTTGKPCIGLLESHLHNVFARERVPGEDFVYTPSSELFNILEDFCDDQQIHESRPPLLILGNSGSGKSALLANWLQRRQRNMTRSRAADDFVFWHAVGCTRQSMDVNNLMRRMMRDLKARFELSRDVPRTQARLSWDLPRFLELGSKKGKVIIVIDGLHRLDSSGGDTNLSWLPLEYPPNVRIIVSATLASNNDSDQSARRNHTIEELQR